MTEIDRLTKIAVRAARRYGAKAAVYANHTSFDVLTERYRKVRQGESVVDVYDGMSWLKNATRDAYQRPADVAKAIRRDMRRLWKVAA